MIPKPPEREYYCDCAKCMRGGRTEPRKVAKATYNRHRSTRTQIQPYSSFLQQHGYEPRMQDSAREEAQSGTHSSQRVAPRQSVHRGNIPQALQGPEAGDTASGSEEDSGGEQEVREEPQQNSARQDSPGMDDMYETLEEQDARLQLEQVTTDLAAFYPLVTKINCLKIVTGSSGYRSRCH